MPGIFNKLNGLRKGREKESFFFRGRGEPGANAAVLTGNSEASAAAAAELARLMGSEKKAKPKKAPASGGPPNSPSSKQFGSFVGKFGKDLWGKTDEAALQESLQHMPRDRLLQLASSMGKELVVLYKAVAILNKLAVELDVYKATENIRCFVLELLGCESVTLFLLDHEAKLLRARVKADSGDWTFIQTAVGEGIAGTVAQTGRSMNIPDAYASDSFNPAIDKATNFKTRSLLCCPIADISGKHVAVIQAVNKLGGAAFRAADEANLELFSVHLGNTITKSRLYASIMFEKQRLEKLHEGMREINTPNSTLDALVMAVNRSVHSVLHAELTLLLFMDNARNQLWSRWQPYSVSQESRLMFCAVGPQQHGLLGRACGERAAQAARDVGLDALGLGPGILPFERAKCALLQPILDIRRERVLAVICCFNKRACEESVQSGLFSEPKFTVNDVNAMALFSIEAGRVLSERSLEISFANALSTVPSSAGGGAALLDLEAALQAQLMSYAGLDEIESVTGSLKLSCDASPRDGNGQPSPAQGGDGRGSGKLLSLADSLEAGALAPQRNTLKMRSQQLRRWDFDTYQPTKEELMVVVFDIFVDSGVLDFFGLEERVLMLWVAKVAGHYRDNPYHNFQHVTHVLHAVHLLLSTTEAGACLTRIDQLALLIAAICHDIDHDGRTNGFHVATSSNKALCYNDSSVLENHHCALTFDLLDKSTLLSPLEKPVRTEIRKLIIGAIMATDMSVHFSLTTDFKNHEEFEVDSPEDRLLLCKTILHAADLSNPTLPFHLNSLISQKVHAEFKQQVAEERRLGIVPMPHMNAKDERVQCLLEVSFIDAVVVPLWEHLALLFPALQGCMSQIRSNREQFQRLSQRRTKSIQEEFARDRLQADSPAVS